MNKQQKIIVSIVGITIVLLALLGITYAYYLTRIEGNTNTNSISITTANLKLSYGDGNEIITASNILPGTTIGEKTFTVTNSGNTTIENYKVVLEYAVIEDVNPVRFLRPQDFEITVSCESKDVETNEISGTCNGYTGNFNNESFEITSNTIDEGVRHVYSLTIFYANPDVDQSDDMGKNLNLKVQIYGATDTSTLNGTITGVESNYTMELHSKTKVSVLTPTKNSGEYSYKFIGVEPGEHTLYVIDASGNEVSSETITINKGTNTNVSGNIITVKDNQSNIYITSTNSDGTLSSSARFNPYSDNTNSLAYHIINNSMNHINGTFLLDNPPSRVAEETSLEVWGKGILEYNYLDDYENISDFGILSYADTENEVYYCYAGENDCPEEEECDASCNNVRDYSGCTDELIGKQLMYVDETGGWGFVEVSECHDGKVVIDKNKNEKVLSKTTDDFGTSYYYRGNVRDNFVNFAGMCWRIVRIAGDGSIKLILQDSDVECNAPYDGYGSDNNYESEWGIGYGNYGYETKVIESSYYDDVYVMNYLNPVTNKANSMVKAFYDFQTNNLSSYTDRLKSGDWCLDDTPYSRTGEEGNEVYTKLTNSNYYAIDDFTYYDSYVRLSGENKFGYQPTLKCNGKIIKEFADVSGVSSKSPMFVSALTADEIIYAGGSYNEEYENYYLNDSGLLSYSSSGGGKFWSLSPHYFNGARDLVFNTHYQGDTDRYYVNSNWAFRPSVSLKSGTLISGGDGTQFNPYVIN